MIKELHILNLDLKKKNVFKKNFDMKVLFTFMLVSLVFIKTNAQDFTVRGSILDAYGGSLIGVNVIESGTSNGTVTDIDGEFSLTVSKSNAVLRVTYIGYDPIDVEISGRAVLNITMQESTSQLDELVVVGYGTQKKVTLTGSVDALSGAEIEGRPAALMSDLIKGASPNLNITMGMRGGEPGATSTWNIRGQGSISANASPLILVDGVEVNINNIDPSTVESVSVLKDASASAIYGSRAPLVLY